jgi:predicted P-loop ATPase
MLILEGHQGLRKSGFFEAISVPWFVSGLSDLTSKDALQELRGVWIIEMAELNNMRRSEANFIKAFLTRKVDHYRESYGRMTSDFPRQCVFAGTVNPGALDYLQDETGARRFWPVPIIHEIDLDVVRFNRDQYWAEAVHRFKVGDAWYMDTADLHEAATAVQSERYEGDEWFWLIEDYLAGNKTGETTTADVLQIAVGLTNASDWGKAEQMRAAKCICRLGWEKGKVKKNNRWGRGWVKKVGQMNEVGQGGQKNDELF